MHPHADADRLYLSRASGGRGLLSVEDIITKERCTLYDYVRNSNEVMLCVVADTGLLFSDESAEQFSFRKAVERLESYVSKPLHGYFFNVCSSIMDKDFSFHWLKSGDLSGETEGILLAAQDKALPTRSIQHLYDDQCTSVCRLFGEQTETIKHIISGVSFWLLLSIISPGMIQ